MFFGRGQEIQTLLELLKPSFQRGAGRLVAVVGPSGSGKSSLVRAGLIPRLARLREPWLVLPTVRPGSRPIRQLALVLADAFRAAGERRGTDDLEATLEGGVEVLIRIAEELCHPSAGEPKRAVLLFVDQAEELMTQAGTQERGRFLSLLYGATRMEGPLWVIFTLRSEFLSSFLQGEGAELFDEDQLLGPLGRARLPQVIEGPARPRGDRL